MVQSHKLSPYFSEKNLGYIASAYYATSHISLSENTQAFIDVGGYDMGLIGQCTVTFDWQT